MHWRSKHLVPSISSNFVFFKYLKMSVTFFLLASLDKKKNVTIKCDVSVAAKSTFLYTSTLDLNSIRGLYRGHLVSTVFLLYMFRSNSTRFYILYKKKLQLLISRDDTGDFEMAGPIGLQKWFVEASIKSHFKREPIANNHTHVSV